MSVKLTCTVNPHIPVTRQRHLVYALIEIDPGSTVDFAWPPTPVNLGLVVDASRSMSIPILSNEQFNDLKKKGMAKQVTVDGVKVWQFGVPKGFQIEAPSNLDFTKEALRVVASYVQDSDCFSLVAFAQDALLMLGNTPGTQKDKLLQAIDRLDRIDLGDETFMARGIEMGYKQTLPGVSLERVSRMVILTDGYTKDERNCYTQTRYAKKEGIVVSTMGLGLDFNEELLISLADISGGHAYFIEEPKDIPDAFRQELMGVQSITWRDLSLTLSLPADVTLRRAHRVQPVISELKAENDVIVLGDLEAGQPPAVLLELVVPPRPAGGYRLAQVTLNGHPFGRLKAGSTGSNNGQTMNSQDILVRYTEKPSLAKQTDAHLMSVIQRVSAFKLQNQAMEQARRGNIAGATKRLRIAGERLIEMGQEDLGQTMLVEAELMEKEGQMSAEGTKKLRYGTRKLK